jgi:hypothetical protein
MLGLLDGAAQLKGRNGGTRHSCDCGANAGSAKPSYGDERFLGEPELIMR